LRGGERAAATQLEVREEVREEASSGLSWLTLIRKCCATLSGAAQATAAPPAVAQHKLQPRNPQWRSTSYSRATLSGAALTERGPPGRRGRQSRATASGVATYSAVPP
jgi:hypothetical protein